MANHRRVQRTKRRLIFIKERGQLEGVVINESPLEQTGRSKCSGFSMAEM